MLHRHRRFSGNDAAGEDLCTRDGNHRESKNNGTPNGSATDGRCRALNSFRLASKTVCHAGQSRDISSFSENRIVRDSSTSLGMTTVAAVYDRRRWMRPRAVSIASGMARSGVCRVHEIALAKSRANFSRPTLHRVRPARSSGTAGADCADCPAVKESAW